MKHKIILFLLLSITCTPQAAFGMKKQKPEQKTINNLSYDDWSEVFDFISHLRTPWSFLKFTLISKIVQEATNDYITRKTGAIHIIVPGQKFQKHLQQAFDYLEKNNHKLILYAPGYHFRDRSILGKIFNKIKNQIVELHFGRIVFHCSKNSTELSTEMPSHLRDNLPYIVDCKNLSVICIPHLHLTPPDIERLKKLPKIEKMEITIAPNNISPKALEQKFDQLIKKHADNLRVFYINTCTQNGHLLKFFEKIIDTIAENLKNLNKLSLFHRYEAPLLSFSLLSPVGKLKNLKSLVFMPIHGADDAGKELFKNLEKLERVTLRCNGTHHNFCYKPESLDDLVGIISSAKNLKKVKLVFCISRIASAIIEIIECGISDLFRTKAPINCKLDNITLIFEKSINSDENQSKLFQIHNLLGIYFESLSKISYTKRVTFLIYRKAIRQPIKKIYLERLQADKHFTTHATNKIIYITMLTSPNERTEV